MMQINRRLLSALGAATLCCAAASTASGQCDVYGVAPGPGTFQAGDADSGIHCDDCTGSVTFPFLVTFYGVSYGSANVSSNGTIQFTTNSTAYTNGCLPSATFAGPTIFALWDDLYTVDTAGGQGIFTSVTGVSPNQVFSIEWRAQNCCAAGAPLHNFCVKFYETGSFFDIVYQTVDAATGADSTVGVQPSAAGLATQYQCNVGNAVSGTSLRFTCNTLAPAGCCASDGTCSLVVQTNCTAPSTFVGGVCSPNPCTALLGGCCVSGVCSVSTPAGCPAPGLFQGAGTICSPNPCPIPPVNDLCDNALTATLGANAGTLVLANSDGGQSCAFGVGGVDVYYRFTPATTGAFLIENCGDTGFDTVISVHTGCPAVAANQIAGACNDDGCGTIFGPSTFSTTLDAGTQYTIRMATYAANTVTRPFIFNITTLGSGACCNNATGVCAITAANGCTGVYLGNDSVCGAAPCGTGACCTAGNCTVSIASDCISGGGTFQGHGATCGGPFYAVAPNANPFVSIAGTGTQLAVISACDDCIEDVSIPFLFPYLGVSFGNVNVASNGYIEFGGTTNNLGNVPIPNVGTPNNFVCGLWDDLNPGVQGDVFTQLDGVSPNQTLTISWENVTQFGLATPDSNNFQIVLHENGQIELRYGALGVEGAAGDWTFGFENSDGTAGVQIPTAEIAAGNTSRNLNVSNVSNPCSISTSGACCCGASCTITTANACTGTGRAFVGGGACAPFSYTSPCCRGDINKVNNVSVQDIFDYLTLYFGNDPCADTNGVNNVSVQDIFDYLTAYFGGPC